MFGAIFRQHIRYDTGKSYWSTHGYTGFIPSPGITGDLLYRSPNSDLNHLILVVCLKKADGGYWNIFGHEIAVSNYAQKLCLENSADELPQAAFLCFP
jgi:hypothetical protein